MRKRDIRTLCTSCRIEYEKAGYRLILIWSEKKDKCDLCRVKYGWTYEVKREFEF